MTIRQQTCDGTILTFRMIEAQLGADHHDMICQGTLDGLVSALVAVHGARYAWETLYRAADALLTRANAAFLAQAPSKEGFGA